MLEIEFTDPGQNAGWLKNSVFSSPASADLFAEIFAARAEEVGRRVEFAQSPPPESVRPGPESWSTPVEAFRVEVERYGQPVEDIIIEPEKKEELAQLLTGLGLDKNQVEQTLEAATRPDGWISLRSVIDSVAHFRRHNANRDSLTLPASLTAKFLGLLGKMGLDSSGLDKISRSLGSNEVALRRLSRLVADLGQPNLRLSAENVAVLKEILLQVGLSPQQASDLIGRHLDPQGRLSLKNLSSLLVEAASKGDDGLSLARSGQLKTMVGQVMSGAKVIAPNDKVEQPKNQELSFQASRIKNEIHNQRQVTGSENQRQVTGSEPIKSLKTAAMQNLSSGNASHDLFAAAAKAGMVAQAKEKIIRLVGGKDKAETSPQSRKTLPRAADSPLSDPPALQAEARKGADLKVILPAAVRGQEIEAAAKSSPRTFQEPEVKVNLASIRPATAQSRAQAQPPTAPARMQPSVLLEKLVGRMVMMLQKGQTTMRLQLHPPELGQVRIDLAVDGRSVRATIITENAQVQQTLGSQSGDLKQSLADQGFHLDQFDVWVQSQQKQAAFDQPGGQDQGEDEPGLEDPGGLKAGDDKELENSNWLDARPNGRVHVVV